MSDISFPDDLPADEMADYLQLYLDETGEQLDGLVETLLALESCPTEARHLDEAFRLLHSIKGSSALLGLDRITTLTHHLESHFVRLRSGKRTLDGATVNVVLRCIDFLRECNDHLRRKEPLGHAADLLEQVKSLEHSADTVAPARAPAQPETQRQHEARIEPVEPVAAVVSEAVSVPAGTAWRVIVHFAAGLPMAEFKAELVLARLAAVGTVTASTPPRDRLAEAAGLAVFEVVVVAAADRSQLEAAAGVDGVDRVVVVDATIEPGIREAHAHREAEAAETPPSGAVAADDDLPSFLGRRRTGAAAAAGPASAETLRVDVERLDVLLNLAGELLVNRARLSELLGRMGPLFRKSGHSGRSSAVADALRGIIHALEDGGTVDLSAVAEELDEQVDLLGRQTHEWNEGRRTFADLVAAVDQLTRVTKSLQHGVLGTRLVPVGPLFSRFKRSIRDISAELGKQVVLELAGEKTEIDKRMIDELGDPLNHLVRNSIDHGIEPADVRQRRGKPETATVRLTAAHRGNNVIITVEDDGGGIDVARVRQTAVERGLVSVEEAEQLDEAGVIDLIWEPGFSTKRNVSDISGRGVGMDIVRTKVRQLNGSIEVTSLPGVGTTFSIRLPLTLTITRCMLFRLPHAVFAVPIEHVREIVRLADHRTVTVHGRQLCDIRGDFLPLVGIEDLFDWSGPRHDTTGCGNVVVLQSGSRSFGLRVDMLLGGQDMVVKPLDQNYAHIRGLGGASILGDGSVSLLLDVATCVELAQPQKTFKPSAVPSR
ncbi:MAG: chemotaxis protein CheA [Planctomycetia bacterium]